MNAFTRRRLLALLALPSGCAIQHLDPLPTRPAPLTSSWPELRAAALGQSWTYRQLNYYNSQVVDTLREEVIQMGPGITLQRHSTNKGLLEAEIQSQWGFISQDPSWDVLQTYQEPLPLWPVPLQPGSSHRLNTLYTASRSSFTYWISVQMRISGQETVELPVGRFQTLRIEKLIRQKHYDLTKDNLVRRETLWLAPEIGRWVVRETDGRFKGSGRKPGEGREDHFRWELTAWS